MLLVNYLLPLRFAALMHSEDLVMVVLSTDSYELNSFAWWGSQV
jgi:hypothetical protein